MKKILALLLVLALSLTLVACGSGKKDAASTGSYKVAMVTDYGDITDQSFNQTTWEAVVAFGKDNNVETKYYKPTSNDTAGRVASVELAIAEGYNVIVMPGYAFGGTIVEVAPNYPDVKFVALDVAKGDLLEGDFDFEERPRILIAGAYSYNHKASRLKGQRGAVMPGDATRNLGSYFVDFILEYRGFAFYTDFMGRSCSDPLFSPETGAFVYNGQGLNVQTSYLFNKKWEIALRNSTLFPDSEVQPLAGYRNWNQTTLGITRYIIGHSLKVQADMSYNTRSRSIDPDYNRWEIRFQLELGL